jgi:hypothetical protein
MMLMNVLMNQGMDKQQAQLQVQHQFAQQQAVVKKDRNIQSSTTIKKPLSSGNRHQVRGVTPSTNEQKSSQTFLAQYNMHSSSRDQLPGSKPSH